MKQIQSLLLEREQSSVSLPEDHSSEWIEKYMSSLKKRYNSLKPVLFCDDYAVDAILSHFFEMCQKNDIITDFLLQGYYRDRIEEEDILHLLHKLLECGWVAVNGRKQYQENNRGQKRWIQLHVAVVKNQLIFALFAYCPTPIRINKKDFRPWIKKYDGILEIHREDEKLEIVLGLTNTQSV